MARLEVELAGVGFEKFSKGINNANGELSSLDASLKKASSSFEKANANALGLEKELQSLNKQFNAGAISADHYSKEQKEIVEALSSSRQAAQGFQSEMNSLEATMKKGVTQVDIFGTQTKKITSIHSSFASGIRSSNGVALEFNRIIQDAPFGLTGIGNNIQQLTANYQSYATQLRSSAAAEGKSISTGQILKGALGGILSPLNLLTLGVSLVTSAWTAYTMWAQKSAKATKENTDVAKSYAETLTGAARAQFEGTQSAIKELTTLKLLFNAYQDANLPLKQRKDAYKQIQQEYPEYFKNIAFEQKASIDTKNAYDQLTGSILATSRARAAANLITKNSERQLENEGKIAALRIDQQKALLAEQKALSDLANAPVSSSSSVGIGVSTGTSKNLILERALATAKAKRVDLDTQIINLSTDTNKLNEQNLELQRKTNEQIAKGGKLIDLNTEKAKKGPKSESDKLSDILARLREELEVTKVQFGSTFEERNLDQIKAYQKAIDATTKLLGAQSSAVVNLRKEQQALFQLTDVKSPSLLTGLQNPALNAKGKGVITVDLGKIEGLPVIDQDALQKFRDAKREISRFVTGFGDDFLRTLTTINQRADQSFTSIIGSIGESITGLLQNTFQNQLGNILDDLTSGVKVSTTQALSSIAGIAGGLVSGLTKKTDTLGQAAGGAITGAAAGALAGSAIPGIGTLAGGLVGGLVGALGGIFGASKARKEERDLQVKQLEEAKKQTEIMRQNSAAYTSSIIGRMTDQGTLTNVEVNSFGQLKATVNGKQIDFILDRTKNSR